MWFHDENILLESFKLKLLAVPAQNASGLEMFICVFVKYFPCSPVIWFVEI